MEKVGIMGAGNFGSAIASILAVNKHVAVTLWDSDPAKLPDQQSLADVVRDASFLFLCVPSWSLREAAASILPHMQDGAIIISPTKGIEQGTLKTSDEILTELFADRATVALLHGPMLATEITEGLPSFATVASKSKDAFDRIAQLFAGSTLTLEHSTDLHGVALAGVLKNVYSIGLGMTEAMRLGSNFRGWFVRAASREMAHIMIFCGAEGETAYTSAGIGDLVATGLSPYSRNCKVGHEIVQSGECSTVSEGGESAPQLMAILDRASVTAPLARAIANIVAGKADASTILAAARMLP
jgi:glycerol-3-phosphate dehydrogenase (NAD(P)+)